MTVGDDMACTGSAPSRMRPAASPAAGSVAAVAKSTHVSIFVPPTAANRMPTGTPVSRCTRRAKNQATADISGAVAGLTGFHERSGSGTLTGTAPNKRRPAGATARGASGKGPLPYSISMRS